MFPLPALPSLSSFLWFGTRISDLVRGTRRLGREKSVRKQIWKMTRRSLLTWKRKSGGKETVTRAQREREAPVAKCGEAYEERVATRDATGRG